MIARISSLKFLAVCVALTVGCRHPAPPAKPPAPVATFNTVIESAAKRVDAGDYAGADRILSQFVLANRGTPEASEIAFWRALYMIDPLNKKASLGEGLRAIDIYLSNPASHVYRHQAQLLRRNALLIQSLRAQQAATKVVGRDTVFVTREDEIAGLKDQLAKANAELDRIKKRLASPSR